jgi:hypothetical protein
LESYTDARIYDILARWQGLRVLRDLWLKRELIEGDYVNLESLRDADALNLAYNSLLSRDNDCPDYVPPRWTTATTHYQTFDQGQDARFHAAVTCLWLMNEIRWQLTCFAYPVHDFRVTRHILSPLRNKLVSQTITPLLDYMDQYATYTFLYHHLLPLHSPALSNACTSNLPLTFPVNPSDAEIPTHATKFLQLCLAAGQTYLQPPDLIDLACRSQTRRAFPYPACSIPKSTVAYQRPLKGFNFPPGLDMKDTRRNSPTHTRDLHALALTHIRIMQRSSLIQTRFPPVIADPEKELFALRDLLAEWFEDRIQTEFDVYACKGGRDMKEVWRDRWNAEVRWGVWWWAASEGKARAKMERWVECKVKEEEYDWDSIEW